MPASCVGVQIAVSPGLRLPELDFRKMKQNLWKSILPLGLILLISFPSSPAYGQNLPARIEIVVVEGQGVVSGVRQRLAHDPVVRVEDDDHRPVAGATVSFALPLSGASGAFLNGSKTLTVVTDKSGQAAAHGVRTNDVPGTLQFYVTATYRSMRARALINQTIEGPAPVNRNPDLRSSKSGSGKWKWVLLGIAAGGGAGAGIYFGTHGGSPSPISISAGTVSFGSPR
jgi:hypothetical protein